MKIVFFGTPQFAVPSLKRLFAAPNIDVVAVVTQPDKRRGRGKALSPSPIKAVAVEQNCPVWQPKRVKKDAETLDKLRNTQADAFVVVAYGQILSTEILEMPRLGCVNGHGSILPQYRGAAPIQWSLYHGEAETGITSMLMDAGMDTGPMLLKRTIPIGLLDNAVDLATRLADVTADLLVETLHGLEQQSIPPIAQDNDAATYAPLIKKDDFQLDWSKPAIALHNQIRGFFPNCVTQFRGMPLKVLQTVPFGISTVDLPEDIQAIAAAGSALVDRSQSSFAAPGTVVGRIKAEGPVIQTGQGLLLLREVQPSGKRSQSGWDFANGAHLEVGEIIGESNPEP